MGKQWKQRQTLFTWAPKSLWTVTAAMKFKDACSLKPAHEATKKLKHVLRVKNTLQRFPAGRLAIWGHSLDLPSIYQNLTEEEVN